MSVILAAQLTAIAAIALALLAFVTALLALLAWRSQAEEIRALPPGQAAGCRGWPLGSGTPRLPGPIGVRGDQGSPGQCGHSRPPSVTATAHNTGTGPSTTSASAGLTVAVAPRPASRKARSLAARTRARRRRGPSVRPVRGPGMAFLRTVPGRPPVLRTPLTGVRDPGCRGPGSERDALGAM
jgi:hypothetical protein